MKRLTKRFALCLDNEGNAASLIIGKVYQILADARAAKDSPESVRKKLIAAI